MIVALFAIAQGCDRRVKAAYSPQSKDLGRRTPLHKPSLPLANRQFSRSESRPCAPGRRPARPAAFAPARPRWPRGGGTHRAAPASASAAIDSAAIRQAPMPRAKGKTRRQTDAPRQSNVLGAQKIVDRYLAGKILVAGIAMKDGGGDERAGAMAGARERRRQDLVESTERTIIGMPPPADVGEQARGMADAPFVFLLAGKQRRNPFEHFFGVARRTADARIGGGGKFEQRILGALFRRKLRIEQAFAKAIGRDHHVPQIGGEKKPLQHHGAERQRLGAVVLERLLLATDLR